jgi:hypothetical protein
MSGLSVKRAIALRRAAKGVGTILVAVVLLDLVATTLTLTLGWEMFKR